MVLPSELLLRSKKSAGTRSGERDEIIASTDRRACTCDFGRNPVNRTGDSMAGIALEQSFTCRLPRRKGLLYRILAVVLPMVWVRTNSFFLEILSVETNLLLNVMIKKAYHCCTDIYGKTLTRYARDPPE